MPEEIKYGHKEFSEDVKNNYKNFLSMSPGGGKGKTPYATNTTNGMNCINGVCFSTELMTKKKFAGPITGNSTFQGQASKEGFHKIDVTKGVQAGDVLQYTRNKGAIGSRFPGQVDHKNFKEQYPNHAVQVVDVVANPKSTTDSLVRYIDNGGKDKMELKEVPKSELFKRTTGYKSFDGLSGYRYDPAQVTKQQQEHKGKIDAMKGINPFAKEYDNVPARKNVMSTDINRYQNIYNGLYGTLGKGSNMPRATFDKLIDNQIGIAGQETKWGTSLSKKLKDVLVPTDGIAKIGRNLAKSFGAGSGDDWTRDYWESNAEGVQKKFKTYDDFKRSESKTTGDPRKDELDRYLNNEAYMNSPRSKGIFQQKELSNRGQFYGYNLDGFEGQVKSSLALAVDNYHLLKNKYPDKSDDDLVKLVTLSHNAPGKANNKTYVDHYLKSNDIDYVNKVQGLAKTAMSSINKDTIDRNAKRVLAPSNNAKRSTTETKVVAKSSPFKINVTDKTKQNIRDFLSGKK